MHCSEFLEIYSDYRDGLITDPDVARRVRHHLRHCTRCMDYDALVSRGVMALRATSDIEPTPLFARGLRRRVAASAALPESLEPVTPLHAGIMVALMVCTAIATAVWAGADRAEEVVATATPPEPQPEVVRTSRPSELRLETGSEFSDWSAPVYFEQRLVERERAVSFETWVASPR